MRDYVAPQPDTATRAMSTTDATACDNYSNRGRQRTTIGDEAVRHKRNDEQS